MHLWCYSVTCFRESRMNVKIGEHKIKVKISEDKLLYVNSHIISI
jgi:hypothetical protein